MSRGEFEVLGVGCMSSSFLFLFFPLLHSIQDRHDFLLNRQLQFLSDAFISEAGLFLLNALGREIFHVNPRQGFR